MFALSLLLTLIAFTNANDIYEGVRESRNFTGKVVLVTGSGAGIGAQTVKLYSALGANVVVTGRHADEIKEVAKECQNLSPKKLKPLEVTADLAKDDDLNRLFNETIKTFKRLDVLVNNAGLYLGANGTDKNFLDVLEKAERVDVRSSIQLIRLSAPYLKQTKGSIVNICSILIERPRRSFLAYDLAKQALEMVTRVMAIELGPDGIRVNCLSPGEIYSYPLNNTDPGDVAFYKRVEKSTPLGRVGQSIDIAKGVVFLSSSDAEYITGHNLVIDGGIRFNMDSEFIKHTSN